MNRLLKFDPDHLATISTSVAMAEELVSNHYKFSATQWLRLNYDIKTLTDLQTDEIVHGPFAQIIRYVGQRKNHTLGSSTYDFYKICIQDHRILSVTEHSSKIQLLPFSLYIITHELVHIVRFSQFLQNFNASPDEKLSEETRVHEKTREILQAIHIQGLSEILEFYCQWCTEFDGFKNT